MLKAAILLLCCCGGTDSEVIENIELPSLKLICVDERDGAYLSPYYGLVEFKWCNKWIEVDR